MVCVLRRLERVFCIMRKTRLFRSTCWLGHWPWSHPRKTIILSHWSLPIFLSALARNAVAWSRGFLTRRVRRERAHGLVRPLASNRSGCENRNHAAACDFWALLGSRDGAASPRKAASCAAVRYSKTLRCCCFNVATTVIMFATKRQPPSLCVPKLPVRHSTPGRSALSAVLFVGSTPSTCTKVHNASRRFKISWQVPSVLATPH